MMFVAWPLSLAAAMRTTWREFAAGVEVGHPHHHAGHDRAEQRAQP